MIKYSSILRNIWELPQLVSKLLLNPNFDDVKNNLAHLITNNFYENILSSNDKEYHLLYIITFLLKYEINGLKKDICNPFEFLSNTKCGLILDYFLVKDKLQSFWILLNIIEICEIKFKSKEFSFDFNNIKTNKNNITKNNIKKIWKFTNIEKYMIDLSLEILEKKMDEFKNKKDKNMKDYINIEECKNGKENIYSINKILNNLKKDNNSILGKFCKYNIFN